MVYALWRSAGEEGIVDSVFVGIHADREWCSECSLIEYDNDYREWREENSHALYGRIS